MDGKHLRYKAVVTNKKKLAAPALTFKPKQLYCEMVRRLLYDNSPPIEKAILVVDEAVAKVHQQ